MSSKNILLTLITIAVIVIFPHLGLIPLFGYSIPITLLVWFALKSSGEKFSDIGFKIKSFKLKHLLIGIISAICIVAFMQLLFFPVLEQFIQFEEKEVGLYAFVKKNVWNYIFMVFMGWIIGGLYEEIVFHGFIFSRVERMLPKQYAIIISFILTSILFGAYHYQLGTAGLLNAFIVGIVYLGLNVYFKQNLWASIICHGTYNSIVMTMIYLGYL